MIHRLKTVRVQYYFQWKPLFAFLIILLFWQIVSSFHNSILQVIWDLLAWDTSVPDWRFLSSPYELFTALPQEIIDGSLVSDSLKTSEHTSIAFMISLMLSLIIANLLFIFDNLRQTLEPIMKAMSGIPPVTLLPVFALALGLDSISIIALGVFGATLSVSLMLLDIFKSLNLDLSTMLENLGYSSLGILLWKLSSISENLYLASREGLRWSLILVIVAEMQIGDVSRGIGYYINSARLNQSYDLVYTGVIACGLVALFLQLFLNFSAKLTHFATKKYLLRM